MKCTLSMPCDCVNVSLFNCPRSPRTSHCRLENGGQVAAAAALHRLQPHLVPRRQRRSRGALAASPSPSSCAWRAADARRRRRPPPRRPSSPSTSRRSAGVAAAAPPRARHEPSCASVRPRPRGLARLWKRRGTPPASRIARHAALDLLERGGGERGEGERRRRLRLLRHRRLHRRERERARVGADDADEGAGHLLCRRRRLAWGASLRENVGVQR